MLHIDDDGGGSGGGGRSGYRPEVARPLSLSLSVTAEAWRADGPSRLTDYGWAQLSPVCSVNVHFSLNFVTEHLGQ